MPVHRHPVANARTNDPLSSIPLDQDLINRLKTSYALVRRHDLKLAELFYNKLFTVAPHLRTLFRTEAKVQAAKLIDSLDAIVANLENPAANAVMLADLGERHAGYGAKPEHYALVSELLVESMRDVLQPNIDQRELDHTLDEWRIALNLVSRQMIAASTAATSDKATHPEPPQGSA